MQIMKVIMRTTNLQITIKETINLLTGRGARKKMTATVEKEYILILTPKIPQIYHRSELGDKPNGGSTSI